MNKIPILREFLFGKIFLTMKFIVIFILVSICNAFAVGYAQNEKITIKASNATFQEVVSMIEKQSNYIFFYKSEDVDHLQRFNINTTEKKINEVLDLIVKNTSLVYNVSDQYIFFNKKNNYRYTVELQQKKDITGIIKDEKGDPVIGANIIEKDLVSNGTVTDVDGFFSLKVSQNAILQISYLGYLTQEVSTIGKSFLEIVLVEDTQALDEVVVIGYGTQKKLSVTGSISAIQTKEIKQSPTANLAVGLAGRLPGLTAIQRTGEPGRELTQLYIRGVGTPNTQAPIILVDGIERELTFVDPTEVESITILKDASSTAIFGTRGANGVILVTTRRGVSEKPEINFTTELTAQNFTRRAKPVNSFDYALLRNLALTNDGLPYQYSAEEIEKFRTGSDPISYPNTDWYSLIFKDFAWQNRYNLNVSGAGKMMRYFVNAGYLRQNGQFKTEKNLSYDPSFYLDRYNFRSNIDMQLNSTLSAFLNAAGYIENINSPVGAFNRGLDLGTIGGDSPSHYLLRELAGFNAAIPGPLTPDGDILSSPNAGFPGTGGSLPPYGELNRSGFIKRNIANVTASYGMEQQLDFIAKGLSAKMIVSYDTRLENNVFKRKNYPKYVQIIENGEILYRPLNADIESPLSTWSFKHYLNTTNVQGYVNYNGRFGKNQITGLLLYQQQKTIINDELPYNLLGFSSRFSYNYDNKYLLEFNAGYNGSEQFAKGRRFGFFPAFSAGWVVSEERFYTLENVLDYLKIRGSIGKVGNDRIGGRRFLYLDDIQLGGGGIGNLGRGQTIVINSLRNENLQWEVANKINIGLEATVLNDFSFVLDVFKERRDNILISRGLIPELIGLPSRTLPPANIGIVDNKGYELELNYRKRIGNDLSILSKINVNYAKNRVIYADEPQLPDDYAYSYRSTGHPLGQYWGYLVDGFFADENDVINSPTQNVGGHVSRPGDLKFKNLNGDDVIDAKDVAPIGKSSIPEYTFGASFGVTYKNFDVSLLFQGVAGVSTFLGNWSNTYFFSTNNYYDIHLNSWTPERAKNNERITFPRLTTQSNPNQNVNSFTVKDASYLRLKNMEIGYTLDSRLSSKIGSNRTRIFLNGFNLLTWDYLPTKNFDPEYSHNVYGGFPTPILRLYNLGINITF